MESQDLGEIESSSGGVVLPHENAATEEGLSETNKRKRPPISEGHEESHVDDDHARSDLLSRDSQPSDQNGCASQEVKMPPIRKKSKVEWTPELHRRFAQAVEKLGVDKAIPSRILELMGVQCLTRHNIASHLQKYRSHRRHLAAREAEASTWQTSSPSVGDGNGSAARTAASGRSTPKPDQSSTAWQSRSAVQVSSASFSPAASNHNAPPIQPRPMVGVPTSVHMHMPSHVSLMHPQPAMMTGGQGPVMGVPVWGPMHADQSHGAMWHPASSYPQHLPWMVADGSVWHYGGAPSMSPHAPPQMHAWGKPFNSGATPSTSSSLPVASTTSTVTTSAPPPPPAQFTPTTMPTPGIPVMQQHQQQHHPQQAMTMPMQAPHIGHVAYSMAHGAPSFGSPVSVGTPVMPAVHRSAPTPGFPFHPTSQFSARPPCASTASGSRDSISASVEQGYGEGAGRSAPLLLTGKQAPEGRGAGETGGSSGTGPDQLQADQSAEGSSTPILSLTGAPALADAEVNGGITQAGGGSGGAMLTAGSMRGGEVDSIAMLCDTPHEDEAMPEPMFPLPCDLSSDIAALSADLHCGLQDLQANGVLDAAISEALKNPLTPLPLGLKPPSMEGVLEELQRQGITMPVQEGRRGRRSCFDVGFECVKGEAEGELVGVFDAVALAQGGVLDELCEELLREGGEEEMRALKRGWEGPSGEVVDKKQAPSVGTPAAVSASASASASASGSGSGSQKQQGNMKQVARAAGRIGAQRKASQRAAQLQGRVSSAALQRQHTSKAKAATAAAGPFLTVARSPAFATPPPSLILSCNTRAAAMQDWQVPPAAGTAGTGRGSGSSSNNEGQATEQKVTLPPLATPQPERGVAGVVLCEDKGQLERRVEQDAMMLAGGAVGEEQHVEEDMDLHGFEGVMSAWQTEVGEGI